MDVIQDTVSVDLPIFADRYVDRVARGTLQMRGTLFFPADCRFCDLSFSYFAAREG